MNSIEDYKKEENNYDLMNHEKETSVNIREEKLIDFDNNMNEITESTKVNPYLIDLLDNNSFHKQLIIENSYLDPFEFVSKINENSNIMNHSIITIPLSPTTENSFFNDSKNNIEINDISSSPLPSLNNLSIIPSTDNSFITSSNNSFISPQKNNLSNNMTTSFQSPSNKLK